jgi:myo-inositol-1(or 4)-monophosphatase
MGVVADAHRRGEDVATVENAAETAIARSLREADPDVPVIGDVFGGETHFEPVWVVDPVDGTGNLAAGDSFVAVTAALLVHGRPVAGATGCPFTGELWAAARGLGASDRSGRRLGVVERPAERWRIALDPAESGPEHRARWKAAQAQLREAFGAVEARSAIALELAYVAAGTFDALVQVGGSPVQDFAAGVLLVREAGGLVTGIDGRDDVWLSDAVVAGTPAAYEAVRELLHGL